MKPYYHYQCDLAEGTAHFRTSVAKGIEIAESLRGHTTGLGGADLHHRRDRRRRKTPVMPDYVIIQAPGQVLLRNYEGVISKYTEPDDYVEGECRCPDCEAGRDRLGVAGMYDRLEPTLSDVWAARLQKVVDRKSRMADIYGGGRSAVVADGGRGIGGGPQPDEGVPGSNPR